MNNYKLYVHIAPNGKRYYGITKQQKSKYRWKNGKGYKDNQHFTNAINKYGWDNIEHIVLFDDLTESEAKELEQYFIQWYQTANPQYGYNQSLGGEGGNSGCERTDEWNKKISEAHKGKKHSEETKQKLREKNLGKIISEETKKKMSKANLGKNSPKSRPIICITTKKLFYGVREAQRQCGVAQSTIVKCCQGKKKSAGKLNGQKLIWKYVNYKHNKTYRVATIDYDHILFDVSDDVIIDYDNII